MLYPPNYKKKKWKPHISATMTRSNNYARLPIPEGIPSYLPVSILQGQVNPQDILHALMLPKTSYHINLRKEMQNDQDTAKRLTRKVKDKDFREFVRGILNDESQNIAITLRQVREEDPAKYNVLLQNWAKFAHPNESNVNVDVNIQSRQLVSDAIGKQYMLSQAQEAEFTEITGDEYEDYDPNDDSSLPIDESIQLPDRIVLQK